MSKQVGYVRTANLGKVRDEFLEEYLKRKSLPFSRFVRDAVDEVMRKEGAMVPED
jgi:hypothetical protein